MTKVHHYMVDYATEAGAVAFANAAEIADLAAAKEAARKASLLHGAAYAIAYVEGATGTFEACGHVAFHDGQESLTEGTIETPRFMREFPDYPAETLPAVPADWQDDSWHNDACPRFTVGTIEGQTIGVFIDYAAPEAREVQGMARFAVMVDADSGTAETFQSDDWQAVLQHVAALKLALQFSANLAAEIGADKVAEAVARNYSYVESCCASHDFCDANMVMAAAFETVTGAEFDFTSDADSDLFNAAWTLAKANGFFAA